MLPSGDLKFPLQSIYLAVQAEHLGLQARHLGPGFARQVVGVGNLGIEARANGYFGRF